MQKIYRLTYFVIVHEGMDKYGFYVKRDKREKLVLEEELEDIIQSFNEEDIEHDYECIGYAEELAVATVH